MHKILLTKITLQQRKIFFKKIKNKKTKYIKTETQQIKKAHKKLQIN